MTRPIFSSLRAAIALLVLASLLVACAGLRSYPAVTEEGLPRQASDLFDAFYRDPSAALADYRRIRLADCDVSFRKNWQRDQNVQRASVYRVTDEDVERIRTMVATDCRRVFAKELAEEGAYEIVEESGAGVLLLRPTIVDLDINAPDLKVPARNTNFVTSAGEMRLRMDVVDSASGRLLARIIDKGRAMDIDTLEVANSVTNRFETDRILRRWARKLQSALQAA